MFLFSISFDDYLKITNENGVQFGVYCGKLSGKTVTVSGTYANLTFRSNGWLQKRGFLIVFTAVPPGRYN